MSTSDAHGNLLIVHTLLKPRILTGKGGGPFKAERPGSEAGSQALRRAKVPAGRARG